jgi:GTP-binding protein Era
MSSQPAEKSRRPPTSRPGAEPPRSGRCALVGRPNVGKSTLLNTLLGQKLAIVASKPQTTRTHILGVYLSADPPTQIAFLDTPGLHRPKNALGRALVESAKGALEGADAVVMLVEVPARRESGDAKTPSAADLEVLATVKAAGRPTVLALNKVDRLADKTALFPLLEMWSKQHDFVALVPMSARGGDNVEALVKALRGSLPEGRLYDDDDFVTDRPERFFVAELVREQVIQKTRQEVPHSVAVLVDSFTDEGRLARIDATVLVEKDSQKKIVIGAGGAMLKAIGTGARAGIEPLLGKQVMLRLWVKVVPDWTDVESRVREVLRSDTVSSSAPRTTSVREPAKRDVTKRDVTKRDAAPRTDARRDTAKRDAAPRTDARRDAAKRVEAKHAPGPRKADTRAQRPS